jgi:fucose permease
LQTHILFPLTAMLAVLTTSSMAVMVVAVLAPEAAPEIGVEATRIGTYTAIVYLAATLAGALIPPMVVARDWQTAALAVAALALLMMALIEPLRSRVDTHRGERLSLDPNTLVAPVRLALGDRRLRRYTLAAFAYAGAQLSIAAFVVVYLTQALGMSLVTAGSVFAALQIGGFAGRLFWGAVAARLANPRLVLAIIGLLTAICLMVTAAADPSRPLTGMFILAGVLGANSFGWNGVILSEIASHAPEGMAAEATAGMQVVMFGGITVFPPTFGVLVTQTQTFTWAWLVTAALAVMGAFLVARVPRS